MFSPLLHGSLALIYLSSSHSVFYMSRSASFQHSLVLDFPPSVHLHPTIPILLHSFLLLLALQSIQHCAFSSIHCCLSFSFLWFHIPCVTRAKACHERNLSVPGCMRACVRACMHAFTIGPVGWRDKHPQGNKQHFSTSAKIAILRKKDERRERVR